MRVSGLVAADGIWSVVARQKLDQTGAMWSRPIVGASSNGASGCVEQQDYAGKNDVANEMRYLGVMIVLGICCSSSLLDFPATDGKTVFQTMDGSTRMYACARCFRRRRCSYLLQRYCMPFVDDTHPLFSWRGGGDKGVAYMWQLSFPVPLQQSHMLMGDKAQLKDLALKVSKCRGPLTLPHFSRSCAGTGTILSRC